MTDKATEFIAEVAVRVIWFVVVYVSLPLAGILVLGLGVRTGNVSYEELNNLLDWAFVTSGLWIIFGVIAAVVAVIGPSLLRRDRMRGRGSLAAIKARSKLKDGTVAKLENV